MFDLNDYVVHTTGGICQIKEIAPLNIPGADKNRKYYFLDPIKPKGSKVFVPVDNSAGIRKVMTDDEAKILIDEIPSIEEMPIDNDKIRELKYKEAIKSCDLRELVKIIKNLHTRRDQRFAEGKKITAIDDKYMKIAEDNLLNELAFALGRDKNEMQSVVSDKFEI
ncbi:MAG: CarD family transcriptional regulator [Lachnospiraceae bacterium]|nr:CarD family transcriptional regulator [Lachnospiraceae bacterium]